MTFAATRCRYLAADGATEVGAVLAMGIEFAQFINEVCPVRSTTGTVHASTYVPNIRNMSLSADQVSQMV